jgi:hypothetical protein
VRAYCRSETDVIALSLDLGVVVVQVDADVARKNREDFDRDLTRPCPPARDTCDEVRSEILSWLGFTTQPARLVLCVPAQAIETWVVAALGPQIVQQVLTRWLSSSTNKEKAQLRSLGKWALFECRDDPETFLAELGLVKSPEAFEAARPRLVAGWADARGLPEASRFEAELAAALP